MIFNSYINILRYAWRSVITFRVLLAWNASYYRCYLYIPGVSISGTKYKMSARLIMWCLLAFPSICLFRMPDYPNSISRRMIMWSTPQSLGNISYRTWLINRIRHNCLTGIRKSLVCWTIGNSFGRDYIVKI